MFAHPRRSSHCTRREFCRSRGANKTLICSFPGAKTTARCAGTRKRPSSHRLDVLATAFFDGTIGILSIQSTTNEAAAAVSLQGRLSLAPVRLRQVWIQRQARVCRELAVGARQVAKQRLPSSICAWSSRESTSRGWKRLLKKVL